MSPASTQQSVRERIPFESWAPIPRPIFSDVRHKRLTPSEGRALIALYAAVFNWPPWVARFRSLEVFAEAIAWEHTLDYLGRVLASLRAKGLIAYELTPGRRVQRYEVELLYTAWDASEQSPSTERAASPSSGSAAIAELGPFLDDLDDAESEQPETQSEQESPSRDVVSPSSGDGASVVVVRDRDARAKTPVRAAKDFSRERLSGREELEQEQESSSVEEGSGVSDVLEAVNRARAARGEAPLDKTPSFYEPITAADEAVIDEIAADLFGAGR